MYDPSVVLAAAYFAELLLENSGIADAHNPATVTVKPSIAYGGQYSIFSAQLCVAIS